MELLNYIGENIGWSNLVVIIILFITVAPNVIKGYDFLIQRFGIETKGSQARKAQSQKCVVQAAAIKALEDKIAEYNTSNHEHWETSKTYQTDYAKTQQDILENLSSLKNMIDGLQKKMDENELRKRIDGLRSTIISFATSLGNPQFKPSEDHYNSIFKKIEEYETILEENDLENGQCSISVKVIEKKYSEAMERGDFLSLKDGE